MTGLARTPDQMPDTKVEKQPEGLAPNATPRFAHLIALADSNNPPKPTALGTPFRFSDANKCARMLSFKALGQAPTNPTDLSGHNNFALGTLIHEAWQEILHADPTITVLDIEGSAGLDGLTSGSFDALVDDDGKRHLLELKSIGGYGYKLAVTSMKGPPEGPKNEHIVQLALNVVANNADLGTLVYVSKESVSVSIAKNNGLSDTDRFCAEWSFDRAVLEPIADKELKRLRAIKGFVDAGRLAPAHIPDLLPPSARVVNPANGKWELRDGDKRTDTGSAWICGYCDFQDVCATYTDRETPKWKGGA